MKISLYFDVSEDQQEICLTGLWMPGFGWIVGGRKEGRVKFEPNLDLCIKLPNPEEEPDPETIKRIQDATVVRVSLETIAHANTRNRRFYVGTGD